MPKSKSKKRKLNQRQPYSAAQRGGNDNANLSHEEIWDDSALLRSWNDAVAEYDFYHSIHARGEDVDEVLRRYEEGGPDEAGEEEEGEVAEDGEVEEEDDDGQGVNLADLVDVDADAEAGLDGTSVPAQINVEPAKVTSSTTGNVTTSTNAKANPLTRPTSTASIDIKPHPPNPTAPSEAITDQTLENLKMAYYWAGYYSGLYDGQQQRQQQQQTQP